MTTSAATATASPMPARRPALALLAPLFALAGITSVLYLTVWFRLLEVIIGDTAYSAVILQLLFFTGLATGALLFNRLVPPHRFHPVRVIAILQLATGLAAVVVTLLIPLLDRFYTAMGHAGVPSAGELILRTIVSAICLFPPAMLIGAMFPAAARATSLPSSPPDTHAGLWPVAILWAANLAGAALGLMLAGFFLFPRLDIEVSIYLAVALNGLIGASMMMVAGWTGELTSVPPPASLPTPPTPINAIATFSTYLATALSAAAACGAFILWGRLLAMLLGNTLYGSSIILAVFLLGLGLGSLVGAMLVRTWCGDPAKSAVPRNHGRYALGWSQVLPGLAIAWSDYCLIQGLPHWPITPSMSMTPAFQHEVDIARCLWAMLPATLCWGAAIPFALAAAKSDAQRIASPPPRPTDDPRIVGRVLAAAFLGAAVAAILFPFWMIPTYHTGSCQVILASLVAIAGVIALVPAFFAQRIMTPTGERWIVPSQIALFGTLLFAIGIPLAVALFLTHSELFLEHTDLKKIPPALVAWGKNLNDPAHDSRNDSYFNSLAQQEGVDSTVIVTENTDGIRKLYADGNLVGSGDPRELRAARLLGNLPALVHPSPKSALILGCGDGVAAGSFILYPEIKHIIIVEPDPLIIRMTDQYFSPYNNGVIQHDTRGRLLSDKVQIVIDDPRHYLRTTTEKFDIIVNNPRAPSALGAAAMFTREYFQRAKDHLNAGGILSHSACVFQLGSAAARCELATFFSIFPNGTLWNTGGNAVTGDSSFDLVLMSDHALDGGELENQLASRLLVSAQLRQNGFTSALDILQSYGSSGAQLVPVLGSKINDDRNLQLSYLAGNSFNTMDEERIVAAITDRRQYPDFLTAPPALEESLRKAWGMSKK